MQYKVPYFLLVNDGCIDESLLWQGFCNENIFLVRVVNFYTFAPN